MTRQVFDFARLVNPLGTEGFLSTYWERQHLLLSRSEPKYYESLITAADLENIISQSDARYPAIRLAKGGGYFSPEVYTHNVKHGDESFLGVPDVKKIAEEYRQGATVALPAIHRTWPALGLFCDQLQAEFDHPAHANVYITPGNAAGFTPHYDTHEVFVLQIAGRKRWSIYAPVIELPHRNQPFTPQAYSGQAAIAQIDLNPGDLLYLPRGFLHSTTTSDSFSAHVTIGITVYTWVDLLKEYLQSAIANHDLRKALPPGFATRADLKPILGKELGDALDQLRGTSSIDPLIDAFTERVRASQIPRPEPFRIDVMVIEFDSTLKMPPIGSYKIIQEGDTTLLEFKGIRYRLPAAVASTIRAMSAQSTFRTSDLPDSLDRDSRLAFSRHLHYIGFLTLVQ